MDPEDREKIMDGQDGMDSEDREKILDEKVVDGEAVMDPEDEQILCGEAGVDPEDRESVDGENMFFEYHSNEDRSCLFRQYNTKEVDDTLKCWYVADLCWNAAEKCWDVSGKCLEGGKEHHQNLRYSKAWKRFRRAVVLYRRSLVACASSSKYTSRFRDGSQVLFGTAIESDAYTYLQEALKYHRTAEQYQKAAKEVSEPCGEGDATGEEGGHRMTADGFGDTFPSSREAFGDELTRYREATEEYRKAACWCQEYAVKDRIYFYNRWQKTEDCSIVASKREIIRRRAMEAKYKLYRENVQAPRRYDEAIKRCRQAAENCMMARRRYQGVGACSTEDDEAIPELLNIDKEIKSLEEFYWVYESNFLDHWKAVRTWRRKGRYWNSSLPAIQEYQEDEKRYWELEKKVVELLTCPEAADVYRGSFKMFKCVANLCLISAQICWRSVESLSDVENMVLEGKQYEEEKRKDLENKQLCEAERRYWESEKKYRKAEALWEATVKDWKEARFLESERLYWEEEENYWEDVENWKYPRFYPWFEDDASMGTFQFGFCCHVYGEARTTFTMASNLLVLAKEKHGHGREKAMDIPHKCGEASEKDWEPNGDGESPCHQDVLDIARDGCRKRLYQQLRERSRPHPFDPDTIRDVVQEITHGNFRRIPGLDIGSVPLDERACLVNLSILHGCQPFWLQALAEAGNDLGCGQQLGCKTLKCAVLAENVDCLRFLLERGVRMFDCCARSSSGVVFKTALMYAASLKRPDCLKTILSYCSDEDINHCDHHGRPALFYAFLFKNKKSISLLLRRTSKILTDQVIWAAVRYGCPKYFTVVMRKSVGDGIQLPFDPRNGSILVGNEKIFKDFLKRNGQMMNKLIDRHHTLLYFAIVFGSKESVQLRLHCGPDMKNVNIDRHSAFSTAIRFSRFEIVDLLVDYDSRVVEKNAIIHCYYSELLIMSMKGWSNWCWIGGRALFRHFAFLAVRSGLCPGKMRFKGIEMSPLVLAFVMNEESVVRFFLANLYFFPEDYEMLRRDRAIRYTISKKRSHSLLSLPGSPHSPAVEPSDLESPGRVQSCFLCRPPWTPKTTSGRSARSMSSNL